MSGRRPKLYHIHHYVDIVRILKLVVDGKWIQLNRGACTMFRVDNAV